MLLRRLVAIAPNAAARVEAQRLLDAEQDAATKAAQDKFCPASRMHQ